MKIPDDKKIVFIDMDGTLIKPKNNKKFPSSILDFELIEPTWKSLKEWAEKRRDALLERKDVITARDLSYIFIVTNQGGVKKDSIEEIFISNKINFISAALLEYIGIVDLIVVDSIYCASNDSSDIMRKPNTGMLSMMLESFKLSKINKRRMIMIGDASGKPGDFSDSDLKTAENFGISYIDVRDLS